MNKFCNLCHSQVSDVNQVNLKTLSKSSFLCNSCELSILRGIVYNNEQNELKFLQIYKEGVNHFQNSVDTSDFDQ